MSTSPLEGKRIVVTGGTLGIGRAVVEACLAAGASVVLCARTADTVDEVVSTLARTGAPVVGVPADVAVAPDVARVFDRCDEAFGGVDGVVHAAGVYGPIGAIDEVDPAAWLDAVRTNLHGSFLVLAEGVRRLRQAGGRIVLLSGGGAATPFANYSSYAAAKAGVVRLVETAAVELAGSGVEVNAVAPGFVATRLHDETLRAGHRAGQAFLEETRRRLAGTAVPVEVPADACVFLLSDAARGITGRFVAAPYDGYRSWPERLAELDGSDLFTLRRIVPKDRGADWQ